RPAILGMGPRGVNRSGSGALGPARGAQLPYPPKARSPPRGESGPRTCCRRYPPAGTPVRPAAPNDIPPLLALKLACLSGAHRMAPCLLAWSQPSPTRCGRVHTCGSAAPAGATLADLSVPRSNCMPALTFATRRTAVFVVLLGVVALVGANARASDVYDAAVAHAGRSSDDLKRDSLDHPADLLRLAGIKPGMRVADFLAADGYYSELLSYIVGPRGHVLLINNGAYDHWSDNAWQQRLANGRLPNVEHRTMEVEHLDMPDHSLDAVLLIKVYHDLYWVATEGPWPKMDPNLVLNEIARTVKPGGVLLL